MRKLLQMVFTAAGLTAGFSFSSKGSAQDLSPTNWTGVYLGGSIGHGWANVDFTFTNDAVFIEQFDHNATGRLVGGHAGLLYQRGMWVFGAEMSLVGGPGLEETTQSILLPGRFRITDVRWMMGAKARVGLALDNWQPYLTAGYAGASMNFGSIRPSNGVTASLTKIENGRSVGGGIDWAIHSNIVFGIAYDYIDLRIDDRSGRFIQNGVQIGPFSITDANAEIHALSARLSLKLGNP